MTAANIASGGRQHSPAVTATTLFSNNDTVVVCTRPTGTRDWRCTKPAKLGPPDSKGKYRSAAYQPADAVDAEVLVTTEMLVGSGIDVLVRIGVRDFVTKTGLSHARGIKPGPLLFSGGLKFGGGDDGLHDVVYEIKAVAND